MSPAPTAHSDLAPSAAPSVSDASLRKFAGYNIRRASNVIQADLAAVLEPFGLRMITFSALVLVVDNPNLTQSQLAGALAIERSNLVVVVDELESRDFIVRNPVPNDRRAYALTATLAGRRRCEKVSEAVRDHEARLLAGLTAAERDGLAALLARIERLANL
jgi:DNA-binding MarR family transcriptional regulator